ncbi:MAG: hypothetical protein KF895_02930 [Parvibaculum sp.]|nr:hypothetical protein [Parvibaculum sp.]
MASSFSDLLRLELQADGENDDTWGVLANRVFELIEASIAGAESLAVTDSDVTLTTANGTADQARKAVLLCSGTLTGNRAVIVPAKTKLYVVRNATAGAYSLTVKTSTGTGIAVPQGFTQLLMCDGTNVVSVTPPVSDSGLGGYFATLRLPETSAPSGVANVGFLYTKDVAGATELFFIDASGNEVQVSDGGKINGAALKDLSVPTGALADKAVTLAKMADLAANKIIGRATGSTGTPEAVGLDSTLAMDTGNLKVVDASTAQKGASALASQAEAEAGTNDTKALTPLKLRQGLRATGDAPIFAARAWVRANASTTPPSILASGNVSSVTRLSSANHDVNFATAMPDANYAVAGYTAGQTVFQASNYRTTAVQITSVRSWDLAAVNPVDLNIIVVR